MNSSLLSGVHPLEEVFFYLTWEHTQHIKYIPEVIYLEKCFLNIAPLKNDWLKHTWFVYDVLCSLK